MIGIAIIFTNIGEVYSDKKQYLIALDYYRKSLQIKRMLGLTKHTGNVLENIGEVYVSLNRIDSAKDYFTKALDIWTANEDHEGISLVLNQLAKLYLYDNDLFKAKEFAFQTRKLFADVGFSKEKLDNTLLLCEIFYRQKHYDSAFKYAMLAMSLKDSVFHNDIMLSVAKMDASFRTKETRNELLVSQQSQRIQSIKIEAQKRFIFLLTASLLLLTALLIALFSFYSSVKKANQKIETLIKELNHRVKNNLQLVSNMLHLQKRTAKDATQMALIQANINRVQSMNIINGLLYKKDFSGLVQMKGFVEALVSNLSYAYKDSANEFEVTLVIDELQLDIEKAIPVGLIVNELITNIYKYGKASEKKSEIEIKLCRNNANWTLEVIDNCKYWDVESEKAKKIGLGLFLIDIFVKQLCGIWRAVSNENGSNHWIEFKA